VKSTTHGSFLMALRVQWRVIHALLMREIITRFGRDNLGFIWLFLEPMVFTVAVTALWSATRLSHASTLPITAFALTGYSSVLLWRNCANHCLAAVSSNAGLLYHRPVRVIDVLFAKILLEIVGATISFILLSVLWISIAWAQPPDDLMAVVGGWVMLCWFGGSLALIIGSMAVFSDLTERLWTPTAYILFPLSGAAFMVDWLTADFQEVILLLPMVHCVELIRDGYFGSLVKTHYDMQYVATICLGMTAVALGLVRKASRRVHFT
jgi:capsular polysaccharide transport system permease protein